MDSVRILVLDTFQRVEDLTKKAQEASSKGDDKKYWEIQGHINLFNKWLRALEFCDLKA